MRWNIENVRFLYPPDDFLGSFTNELMQARHEAAQKQKIDDLLAKLKEADDPVSAMLVLNRRSHLDFLLKNIDLFKADNSFEKTVLLLYYRKNTPFVGTDDLPTWKKLFDLCDPQNLNELGKPLPQSEVTVYRGSVTGKSTGLSWTTSREKAAWFLNRWEDKDMGGGTVFSLLISKEDILVHIVDKEKQEVILKPEMIDKIQPSIVEGL